MRELWGGDGVATPESVADEMVASVPALAKSEALYVADFAAGAGDLLLAARRRWPGAVCIGVDVEPSMVEQLRQVARVDLATVCDFLTESVAGEGGTLGEFCGCVSVILLNPPFSCRGGRYAAVRIGEDELRCSVAAAFLVKALRFLEPGGWIIAIVPAGSLDSERDEAAWAHVRTKGLLEIIGEYPPKAFPGCHLRTALVRFELHSEMTGGQIHAPGGAPLPGTSVGEEVMLVRGSIPVHLARVRLDGSTRVVHTKDLRDGAVRQVSDLWALRGRGIRGPAVLLPRVGQPTPGKVVAYLDDDELLLSDCVLGIRCGTADAAIGLRAALVGSWGQFSKVYVGSCAPYTTVARVAEFLQGLGYDINDVVCRLTVNGRQLGLTTFRGKDASAAIRLGSVNRGWAVTAGGALVE